jgi:hypothetical protein
VEKAEAEEKIRLKQYVSLRSKRRHNTSIKHESTTKQMRVNTIRTSFYEEMATNTIGIYQHISIQHAGHDPFVRRGDITTIYEVGNPCHALVQTHSCGRVYSVSRLSVEIIKYKSNNCFLNSIFLCHNIFVFQDRSMIFGMWVHDHKVVCRIP